MHPYQMWSSSREEMINMITAFNPIIWSDIPDMDIIRVKDAFYMVSTSMHSMPGCPIMKSVDLVHWTLVNYVFETLEDCPGHNLEDEKGIYGKGSWAASLKQYKNDFYVVFNCNDMQHMYIYKTQDIENGTWVQCAKLPGFYHDPALLFQEDGTPFIIYGCGDIKIFELEKDLSGINPNGVNSLLFSTPREGIGLPCEGGHAYIIDGKYYLLYIEWPKVDNQRRRVVCYRSDALLGPYERKVILDDDMGYFNQGVAQGCIFDTPKGEWYAMFFQDHHAVGRIPNLQPVTWVDGWPIPGKDGKALKQFNVPLEEDTKMEEAGAIIASDNFQHMENKLALQWQWNHNPDNSLWSFTECPGYLRLKTGKFTSKGILQARNTLTQRTFGPSSEAITKLLVSGMQPGDSAGLVALMHNFALAGVRRAADGSYSLVMCENDGEGGEQVIEQVPLCQSEVYLKIHFDFAQSVDKAYCFYSTDGIRWKQIGKGFKLRYTLEHFMGCRIGLYCYATAKEGGHADFEFFENYQFQDGED